MGTEHRYGQIVVEALDRSRLSERVEAIIGWAEHEVASTAKPEPGA